MKLVVLVIAVVVVNKLEKSTRVTNEQFGVLKKKVGVYVCLPHHPLLLERLPLDSEAELRELN